MKLRIAVALLLFGAQPAYACHKFSRWYYPYPQRCGLKYASYVPEPVARPEPLVPEAQPYLAPVAPPVANIPEVIVPDLPSNWEEIQREDAIIKLRNILNKRKDHK